MNKLIRALQKAHAGEIAAYHAYEGHWRSVKDPAIAKQIRFIQRDELKHIIQIRRMLKELHAQPSSLRDAIFWLIGKSASALCYITGFWAPMVGAQLIEKIGATEYSIMSKRALELGLYRMHLMLMEMSAVEFGHEWYFSQYSRVSALKDNNHHK